MWKKTFRIPFEFDYILSIFAAQLDETPLIGVDIWNIEQNVILH